jgi:anti-sigma regulatory factor (Ser/Thr protein kinase)
VLRSEWSMHWSFDARDYRSARDVRELFIAYLKAKGQGDADYAGAELVFGELIGNVVRHAPGIVDIEIEWRGTSPVLHVLDRGPGYNREAVLPATYSENGRGLFLVTQLTREFTVTRLPGYGSHARAVLPIERSA